MPERRPVYRWQCCRCGGDNGFKHDRGCAICWNHWRSACCHVYDTARQEHKQGQSDSHAAQSPTAPSTASLLGPVPDSRPTVNQLLPPSGQHSPTTLFPPAIVSSPTHYDGEPLRGDQGQNEVDSDARKLLRMASKDDAIETKADQQRSRMSRTDESKSKQSGLSETSTETSRSHDNPFAASSSVLSPSAASQDPWDRRNLEGELPVAQPWDNGRYVTTRPRRLIDIFETDSRIKPTQSLERGVAATHASNWPPNMASSFRNDVNNGDSSAKREHSQRKRRSSVTEYDALQSSRNPNYEQTHKAAESFLLAPLSPPTPPNNGAYLVQLRRPSGSNSRPSTRNGQRPVSTEIIIQFGSKEDKLKKKRPSISVSPKPYDRSSLSSKGSNKAAIESDSESSEASYTLRTGFPEVPLPPPALSSRKSSKAATKATSAEPSYGLFNSSGHDPMHQGYYRTYGELPEIPSQLNQANQSRQLRLNTSGIPLDLRNEAEVETKDPKEGTIRKEAYSERLVPQKATSVKRRRQRHSSIVYIDTSRAFDGSPESGFEKIEFTEASLPAPPRRRRPTNVDSRKEKEHIKSKATQAEIEAAEYIRYRQDNNDPLHDHIHRAEKGALRVPSVVGFDDKEEKGNEEDDEGGANSKALAPAVAVNQKIMTPGLAESFIESGAPGSDYGPQQPIPLRQFLGADYPSPLMRGGDGDEVLRNIVGGVEMVDAVGLELSSKLSTRHYDSVGTWLEARFVDNVDNVDNADRKSEWDYDASLSGPSSYAASVASVFSVASLASSASDTSRGSGYSAVQIATATKVLLSIFYEDKGLLSLYKSAMDNQNIGPERLQRNLRRLFRAYSGLLESEATEVLEYLASQLVLIKSGFLAQSIIEKLQNGRVGAQSPCSERNEESSDEEDNNTDAHPVNEDAFEDLLIFREFLVESKAFRTFRGQLESFITPKSTLTTQVEPTSSHDESNTEILKPVRVKEAQRHRKVPDWQTWRDDVKQSIDSLFHDTHARTTAWIVFHLIVDAFMLATDDVLIATGQLEPPLMPSMVRLRWQCTCGKSLHSDISELREGGTNELMGHMKCTSGAEVRASPYSHQSGNQQYVVPNPIQWIRRAVTWAFGRSTEKSSACLPQHNTSRTPRASTSTTSNPPPQHRILHLLACMHRNRVQKVLKQDRMEDVTTDRTLLCFLRKQYHCHRGRFRSLLSLQGVKGISFVRFRLPIGGSVDVRHHDPCCAGQTNCECIPPPPKVEPAPGAEYRCIPGPPATYPPIPPVYLASLFTCPTDVHEQDTWILDQLPKRTCGELQGQIGQPAEGWGIYYDEGLDGDMLAWTVLVVFLVASLLFGVLWSRFQYDIQGAFGVSAYMVACCAAVLPVIVTRLRNKG